MADGKVKIYGGKVLLVGGKVALADACCCGDLCDGPCGQAPTPTNGAATTGDDPTNCPNTLTWTTGTRGYSKTADYCQWYWTIGLTPAVLLFVTYTRATGIFSAGILRHYGVSYQNNDATQYISCVDGNLVGEFDIYGVDHDPWFCAGYTAHMVIG